MTSASTDRGLLRHALATLAYRAEKALHNAPPGFAEHVIGPQSRTPRQIVAHLGDLIEWAHRAARGEWRWEAAGEIAWDAGVERFFDELQQFDALLAGDAVLGTTPEKLFQGPIADALTHVGQLALLRGHFGAPIRPESYARAAITAGRVGRDQPGERYEFDGDASARA